MDLRETQPVDKSSQFPSLSTLMNIPSVTFFLMFLFTSEEFITLVSLCRVCIGGSNLPWKQARNEGGGGLEKMYFTSHKFEGREFE